MARVRLRQNKVNEAEKHASDALGLDPDDPSNRALLAGCHLQRKRWKLAIEQAEAGLALDPDDEDCLNIRSLALNQLGRFEEAEEDVQRSLELDPEDPRTHANAGWNLLRRGEHHEARKHFLEALRLEPGHEWARAGLIEAIKTSNPPYRWLFRFMLWLASFPPGQFFMLMIGSVILRRSAISWAESNPALEIPLMAVVWGIFALFVFTMISGPISNLALFLHPLGRHALMPRERIQAMIVGLGCLPVIAGVVAFMMSTGPYNNWAFELLLMAVLGLIPLAFASAPERLLLWSRASLWGCCALLYGLSAGAVYFTYEHNQMLNHVDTELRAVDIDGIQAWIDLDTDNAQLTIEQRVTLHRLNGELEQQSWIIDWARQLNNYAIWGLVGFTWLGGMLRREA